MIFSSPRLRRLLFAELAKLSATGMSMEQAGQLMRRRWKGKPMVAVADALDDGINRGLKISESLAPALTRLETGVVEAAEASGRLAEGFQHLADWHAEREKMQKAVLKALAYPLLLMHMAAAMPVLIASVPSGANPAVPLLVRFLGIWGVLGILWLGWRLLVSAAERSAAVDGLVMKIPLLGKMHRQNALARWCMVLHFQMQAGRLASHSLEAAGEAAGSALVRTASHRAADAAAAGVPMGASLMDESVMDQDCASALATAEESGSLHHETGVWARYLLQSAVESMESAARWIPRMIYVIAAVWAIYQIFAIAGGYFKMLTSPLDGM